MNHEIDLKKYNIRTDLILEQLNDDSSFKKEEEVYGDIKVINIVLNQDNCILGKKKGIYLTICFEDVTDKDNFNKVKDVLISKFKYIMECIKVSKKDKVLVVGLGNSNSTPDSLGPLVNDKIIVTRHLFEMGVDVSDNYSNVSILTPSVMGNTGVESYEVIKGVINEVKPSYLVVIDALNSSSILNVNKTIQITTSGISPGSGIGNFRTELSYDTLGIPVIALGVPTVVDAVTIVSDTLSFLMKKFSYNKKNINNHKNKLKMDRDINYLKDDPGDLSNEDKSLILGYLGDLSSEEFKSLIYEVLTPIGYNLMVTPKEIDFVLERISKLIASSLNVCFHDVDDTI